MTERRNGPQKVIAAGTRVTDATAIRKAWRRQRVRALGVVVVSILAVAGIALSVILSLDTQDRVEVASRCQNGDLFACRDTAENLRRACSKSILTALPETIRRTETRKCAALKMGATARRRQRSDSRQDRRDARRSRAAERRRERRDEATRPRSTPSPQDNGAPSSPKPSEPSPAPSGPASTPAPQPTPQPVVTYPREVPLPCVKVLDIIDCG